MKGNPDILSALNQGLAIELTASSTYASLAAILDNAGFKNLASYFEAEAKEEAEHRDKVLERIAFLEGSPQLQFLPAGQKAIDDANNIPMLMNSVLAMEKSSAQHYNQLVSVCVVSDESGTRDLAAEMVRVSEDGVNWAEEQLGLIKTLGLQLYLNAQI